MAKHHSENERRGQVLNAILECIYKGGIESLTLDKIAEEAKCSKGVIAYYFKTKQGAILESYKAFLNYYSLKITERLENALDANDMLMILVEESFPKQLPKDPETDIPLNVSTHCTKIPLQIPEYKEAGLFMHFFTAATTDSQLRACLQEAYARDTKGIGELFGHVHGSGFISGLPSDKLAYGFLAMVVGLSFFRVTGIQDTLKQDDQSILLHYLKAYALLK